MNKIATVWEIKKETYKVHIKPSLVYEKSAIPFLSIHKQARNRIRKRNTNGMRMLSTTCLSLYPNFLII
jgi:hypothetical protein